MRRPTLVGARILTVDEEACPACPWQIHYETGAHFARFVFWLGHTIAMDPDPPQCNASDFFGKKFGSSRR